MIRLAIRKAPPIGKRPRWLRLEQWADRHRVLVWLFAPVVVPWYRLELWAWRQRLRRPHVRPDRVDAE